MKATVTNNDCCALDVSIVTGDTVTLVTVGARASKPPLTWITVCGNSADKVGPVAVTDLPATSTQLIDSSVQFPERENCGSGSVSDKDMLSLVPDTTAVCGLSWKLSEF